MFRILSHCNVQFLPIDIRCDAAEGVPDWTVEQHRVHPGDQVDEPEVERVPRSGTGNGSHALGTQRGSASVQSEGATG